MDKDGYPEEQELDKIREWSANDYYGLMEYVRERWYCGDIYFRQVLDTFYLSTVGWSGNEDIVAAIQENVNYWWMFHWHSSRRGGHYIFTEKTTGQPQPEPNRE
jgi:hypothetical protein